jgi:hypothetical protein
MVGVGAGVRVSTGTDVVVTDGICVDARVDVLAGAGVVVGVDAHDATRTDVVKMARIRICLIFHLSESRAHFSLAG